MLPNKKKNERKNGEKHWLKIAIAHMITACLV